jgi:NADPH:quinone reductase-like Zn-dependent oxidoreductase
MRAIEAQTFSGYGGLRQIELPKPQPARSRVLVRVTAAGVTPLDYTILSGGQESAAATLIDTTACRTRDLEAKIIMPLEKIPCRPVRA